MVLWRSFQNNKFIIKFEKTEFSPNGSLTEGTTSSKMKRICGAEKQVKSIFLIFYKILSVVLNVYSPGHDNKIEQTSAVFFRYDMICVQSQIGTVGTKSNSD